MQDPLDENQVDGEGDLASTKGTATVLATCSCFKTGSNGTTPDLTLRHTLEVLQLGKLGATGNLQEESMETSCPKKVVHPQYLVSL